MLILHNSLETFKPEPLPVRTIVRLHLTLSLKRFQGLLYYGLKYQLFRITIISWHVQYITAKLSNIITSTPKKKVKSFSNKRSIHCSFCCLVPALQFTRSLVYKAEQTKLDLIPYLSRTPTVNLWNLIHFMWPKKQTDKPKPIQETEEAAAVCQVLWILQWRSLLLSI